MAPRRGHTLRNRIFFSFLAALLPVVVFCIIAIEIYLVPAISANARQELHNATLMLKSAVQTAADVAVRNHLKAIAEKNAEIASHFLNRVAAGEMSLEQAKIRAREILLAQRIGNSGYIYCIDSQGMAVVHPNPGVENTDNTRFAFVREQMERKQGYIEYEWQNPGEKGVRPKALYMVYVAGLDWIISVSSYRAEFNQLIDIGDFRNLVLSPRFGASGYAYVVNQQGETLIHPVLADYNALHRSDQSSAFLRTMIDSGSGAIEYRWRNPGESATRDKIAVYESIAEYGWLIVSSSYKSEILGPAATGRKVAYGATVFLCLASALISYLLSGRLTRPVAAMIAQLDRNTRLLSHEPLPVHSDDELGRLAGEFNNFLATIEANNDELQQQKDRYLGLFETSPDSLILLCGHVLIDCNPAALSIFAGAKEAIIGKTLVDLSPPQQHGGSSSADLAVRLIDEAKSGGLQTFEWQHRALDGRLFDAEVQLKRFGEDAGEMLLVSFIHDITERKRAQEALLESEKQISSIFRSAPVGIGSVVNRVLTKVNNRLCEMTGYDEAELIGRSARMLYLSDEDFEFVGREKYAQIADHGTGTVDTRWQKHDGTIIDVLLSSTPVDLQNHLKGVTFTALDITERKQAENNLRMAHGRMLTILDGIDSSVYVADMDTYEILFMNQKMITDFGGNKTGDLCYSAFRKISKPCDCCTNDQLVDKDGNPAGVCIWHDNNPVSGRYFINYDRAIQWTDGRLVRMQIATDVTDLKRIEAQLHHAQKMDSVGRLAGGVAHDFNNMLGVILGYTELAMERVEPDNPLHANLEKIQDAAQRSANLTRQLLAFARKQTVSPKVIDLNNTIESVLKMLLRLIGEDIDLAWQPGKEVWPVKMDPIQVDQILTNLCVNARDAIVDVGKLTIETSIASFDEEYCSYHAGFVPGDYVLLAVSDTGCGMDKETQAHLFEPFFTTKEMGKGTGLGLATVYGVVKQNNGFINVYSEPGHGTTFKIYLPRHLDKTVPLPEKEPDKLGEQGRETVLLVEDEPAILEMTTEMLKRLGYTVLAAGTPGEAICLAQEYPGRIDLLLTDVVMPEMNGRDLAKNLLAIHPGIRRLFMSGYTANVIAHHCVLDEGVHFIQKPFSMKDLGGKLREALEG
jgi:PAS domain S-box-containing protein